MSIVARSRWFTIIRVGESNEVIQASNEVIVIALDDDGAILLIEEPAYAFGTNVFLFPGGVIEVGESVVDGANRELREETGFAARHLTPVGVLRPWSKYLQVSTHVVLARGLYSAPLPPDETHDIPLYRKSYAQLRRMISAGEILDARVIAALTLAFDTDGHRAKELAD